MKSHRVALGFPIIVTGFALTGVGARAEASPVAGSVDAAPVEVVSLAAAAPAGQGTSDTKRGACAEGMVEVEGEYCSMVEQTCLRWIDTETKMRCAEFSDDVRCVGSKTKKRFCVDRFEWPNQEGAKPVIMKTWYEARAACQGAGKRLCTDSEWTLACEGNEMSAYPYGNTRDSSACNIDKPHPEPDEKAIANPFTRDAEVARLDQRATSGEYARCVSAFGVHDMTGNVDEWVVNESGKPYQSGLKGGYWGPVRTRCRPMTTAHFEQFMFYQIGFRCCGDVPGHAQAATRKPTTSFNAVVKSVDAPAPRRPGS
jgi:sulfatase modifying factor 1